MEDWAAGLSVRSFSVTRTIGHFRDASAFFGVGAPRGTPAEIIERLNGEINAALREPAIPTMLADLSGMPIEGSAAEFGAFVADETTKWGRVIRSAGLKAD